MSFRTRLRRRTSEVTTTTSNFVARPHTVLNLNPIEDRRRYHPEGPARPAKTVTGNRVTPLKVKIAQPKKYGWKAVKASHAVPKKIRFDVPKETLICIRREQRREVLHALKKIKGRGKGGSRKLNWFSEVSCKR